MKSVIAQTYDKIEYIIVDGASTDNTLDIVNQYQDHIDQLISEPDKGLYDAMNKGIQIAKGDYLLFLNAGDILINANVVSNVFSRATTETDVFYGETMLINEEGEHLGKLSELSRKKYPQDLTWKSLKYGMVVCHQSFIAKKAVVSQYIDDNLCADIDWVIECLKKSKNIVNTNIIIAGFLLGGISKQQHTKSLKDRYKVFKKHFGFVNSLWIHLVIVGRVFLFSLKKQKNKFY